MSDSQLIIPKIRKLFDALSPTYDLVRVDTISSSLVLFFLPDSRIASVESVLQRFATPAMRDARVSSQKGPFSPKHWYDIILSVGRREMWLLVPQSELATVRMETNICIRLALSLFIQKR